MDGNGIRVLIADSYPYVRSALRLLLEEALNVIVVGEANDLEQMMELVNGEKPDLVLLDWELLVPDGVTALTGLQEALPGLAVIALSGSPEAQREALAAGVNAFVSKGDPPERLISSVNNCYHRLRTVE